MRNLLCAIIVLLASAAPALAWHGKGHARVARAAVAAVPEEMPPFFRHGTRQIVGTCNDPDLFTRPIAPAELHDAEAPEHYFDIELLAKDTAAIKALRLPATRYEYLQACFERKLAANKIGLLPYAVTEYTERLAVAMAEYRHDPNDAQVQAKCLFYAGLLAHYGADLCQPLHTTIHYDGRVGADGASSRSGIHSKTDALIQKLPDDGDLLKGVAAKGLVDVRKMQLAPPATGPATKPLTTSTAARPKRPPSVLLEAVLGQIKQSHALVDRVYELEKSLPAYEEPQIKDAAVRDFAADRVRTSAQFVASLYLTAWQMSEHIPLPEWYKREKAQAEESAKGK